MSRISRKQMKRNEMAETVGSVVEYTRDHTRTLAWSAIAVVAALVLIAAFFIWRAQRAAGATEDVQVGAQQQAQVKPPDGASLACRKTFGKCIAALLQGAAEAFQIEKPQVHHPRLRQLEGAERQRARGLRRPGRRPRGVSRRRA